MKLPKTSLLDESHFLTNNFRSLILSEFGKAAAADADRLMLESLQLTPRTLALTEELTLSAKEDSPALTGPSLLLSDPSIPKWTSESSSPRTTGQPSSTSKGIPPGLLSMVLYSMLEPEFLKNG